MKKYKLLLTLLLFILVPSMSVAKETVFTYRTPESVTDKRYDYDNAVLKLALDKTKAKWGDYRLVPSPTMNFSRAIDMLESGKLENPMFKISASNNYCAKYEYAPFPVDLGIVGYRLFFTSDGIDARLSEVQTLKELQRFSIGQGYGWLDVNILGAAGFTVAVVPTYDSLFPMVAQQRFDLLSRGVNEIEAEYNSHLGIANFMLNRRIGLYYPLPRFFFTNKGNTQAARRVYEGLVKAYNDGSLLKLWEQKYRSSIEFGQVKKVRFFQIENPFIDEVDTSYKQFLLGMPNVETAQ